MSILAKWFKWAPMGRVPELNAKAVYKRIKKNDIQILDVRFKVEWGKSHIEGAVNLPITKLSAHNIAQLNLSPDKAIVVICLSAHRSIPGVRQLKELGFDDSYQLEGGMISWWRAKFPTISFRP